MSNVVWEGFGTEEDERYLSSVNPFSDAASLESTIEYRLMQADDTLIDSLHTRIPSFHIDLPRFSPLSTSKSWSSVLLKNPIPPPPLPPAPSPAPEEREEVKPKEVCRYWLAGNCIYGDKCWYAHTLHPEAANQVLEYSTECCICQEDVLKAGKRFGLMQSSDHHPSSSRLHARFLLGVHPQLEILAHRRPQCAQVSSLPRQLLLRHS